MKSLRKKDLYIGVDVGGTKIMAALVTHAGAVLARKRMPTPRKTKGEHVIAAIGDIISVLMTEAGVDHTQVRGIGLAIPGVVAPDEGKVIVTPNMTLSGLTIGPILQKRLKMPVLIGNDANLGTLGEAWLGAGRDADSVVGIFVGTGIGAGVVVQRQLVPGFRNAGGEIGHITMQIGGPECGCGNRGCLEALASRSAIERDIRAAIQGGRKSVVTKLTNGDLSVIKSSVLSRALKQEDEVVTGIMRRASEMLGYACLTVRHLLDPETIVLGGGVIEACGEFIVPIVEQVLGLHSMPGSIDNTVVAVSQLGDDAVAIGAAALIHSQLEHHASMAAEHTLHGLTTPHIMCDAHGVKIDGVTYAGDVMIRADGRIKEPDFTPALNDAGFAELRTKALAKLCAKGAPQILIVGTDKPERLTFSTKADALLQERGITRHVCSIPDALELYRKETGSRALYVHRQQ